MLDMGRSSALFSLFFEDKMNNDMIEHVTENMELFWLIQDFLTVESPQKNFISAVGQSITYSMGLNLVAKRAFEQQLVALSFGFFGPFTDLMFNSLEIGYNHKSSIKLINFAGNRDKVFSTTKNSNARSKFFSKIRHELKSEPGNLVLEKLASKTVSRKLNGLPFVEGLGKSFSTQSSFASYRIYPDAFLEGKNGRILAKGTYIFKDIRFNFRFAD